MYKIGITGGIGSGKSHVAGLIRRLGVPVYDTDREAKRLMVESEAIRRGLTELMGATAYLPDGSLNRKAVATYLFASPKHAELVDNLVHPTVRADFIRWAEEQSVTQVAMECAILYESGFDSLVDGVIVVHAPEEVCIQRAMRRDGSTEEQVRARMAAQMSGEERCKRTRYIIHNNTDSDLQEAVRTLMERMTHDLTSRHD